MPHPETLASVDPSLLTALYRRQRGLLHPGVLGWVRSTSCAAGSCLGTAAITHQRYQGRLQAFLLVWGLRLSFAQLGLRFEFTGLRVQARQSCWETVRRQP